MCRSFLLSAMLSRCFLLIVHGVYMFCWVLKSLLHVLIFTTEESYSGQALVTRAECLLILGVLFFCLVSGVMVVYLIKKQNSELSVLNLPSRNSGATWTCSFWVIFVRISWPLPLKVVSATHVIINKQIHNLLVQTPKTLF